MFDIENYPYIKERERFLIIKNFINIYIYIYYFTNILLKPFIMPSFCKFITIEKQVKK